MSNIRNILTIIKKTKGLTVEKVAEFIGMTRVNMYNHPELSENKIEKFVKKYYTEIEQSGFEVIDNYDAFGYKGKAIVKKGDLLYAGKFIEVSGQDNKSGAQDVNLDRQEKSFSSVLKSIAEAQQELADRLKNLSAAAESVSSEELDRIFQEIIAPEKSSAEKTDKRGRSSDKP